MLIPASGAFASNDFSGAEDVLIGRTEDWIIVHLPVGRQGVNSCTLHLKIEKERRFPNIDLQIPTQGSAATTLVLSDDDVDFLLTSTKRLPGVQECNSPVTVDLNGCVAVRAAEALRDSLSRALSDTRELITLIKRNQKQNRLVETTLRSLKQLEHIGA